MNHAVIQSLKEAPTMSMGGNFDTGTNGGDNESTLGLNNSTSKLAGIPSILGMKSSIPVVAQQPFISRRNQANREDQERRTRLLAILMRRSQPIQESGDPVLPPTSSPVTDKFIVGLTDKTAQSMPPGKNIPPTNKPTESINGLYIRPDLPAIYAKLQQDAQRFTKLNINPDKINDASYIYKTRNVSSQADRMNNLNGIELSLFFRPEDTETDSAGNIVGASDMSQKQKTLLKHFNRKQNK